MPCIRSSWLSPVREPRRYGTLRPLALLAEQPAQVGVQGDDLLRRHPLHGAQAQLVVAVGRPPGQRLGRGQVLRERGAPALGRGGGAERVAGRHDPPREQGGAALERELTGHGYFFRAFPATRSAMATACFWGLPAAISVLMFWLTVALLEPFRSGTTSCLSAPSRSSSSGRTWRCRPRRRRRRDPEHPRQRPSSRPRRTCRQHRAAPCCWASPSLPPLRRRLAGLFHPPVGPAARHDAVPLLHPLVGGAAGLDLDHHFLPLGLRAGFGRRRISTGWFWLVCLALSPPWAPRRSAGPLVPGDRNRCVRPTGVHPRWPPAGRAGDPLRRRGCERHPGPRLDRQPAADLPRDPARRAARRATRRRQRRDPVRPDEGGERVLLGPGQDLGLPERVGDDPLVELRVGGDLVLHVDLVRQSIGVLLVQVLLPRPPQAAQPLV